MTGCLGIFHFTGKNIHNFFLVKETNPKSRQTEGQYDPTRSPQTPGSGIPRKPTEKNTGGVLLKELEEYTDKFICHGGFVHESPQQKNRCLRNFLIWDLGVQVKKIPNWLTNPDANHKKQHRKMGYPPRNQ